MGWKGTIRSMQAAARARERASHKRQRELVKRKRELNKANEKALAAHTVETFENLIERLISIHKEGSEVIDWNKNKSTPSPAVPQLSDVNERKARERFLNYKPNIFTKVLKRVEKVKSKLESEIESARKLDEQVFLFEQRKYEAALSEWQDETNFASRILGHEKEAFLEIIKELNPFEELSELGSEVRISVPDTTAPGSVTVDLKIHGAKIIPNEKLSLLKTGKLSSKKMTTGEFNKLYQDHVCSCILRIGRELFAILPITSVIVSVLDDLLDSSTGNLEEKVIVSAMLKRETMNRLNLESLDPSDSMKNFIHKMNFKTATGFASTERVCAKD